MQWAVSEVDAGRARGRGRRPHSLLGAAPSLGTPCNYGTQPQWKANVRELRTGMKKHDICMAIFNSVHQNDFSAPISS